MTGLHSLLGTETRSFRYKIIINNKNYEKETAILNNQAKLRKFLFSFFPN